MTDNARSLPPLKISSAAEMVEWLRDHLGTGHLSGMFARQDRIVFCPRIGEAGYIKLTADDRDDDGPAQVRPLDTSGIASYIQLRYWCHKMVKVPGEEDAPATFGPAPAMFPVSACRPAVDHPWMQEKLRPLRGVTHAPIPRADGTVLDIPGYDAASQLLYLPERGLTVDPVPAEPGPEQVVEALKLLRWVIKDFAFATEHDEANWLGALLTPLLRELAPPPYKLIAITAPQPGSGKSLLAAILRAVHGGVFRSEVPTDDAEMRKAISTILEVTTGPVVQLDNLSGVLRSSVLSGLLTSGRWEDRRLGSNSQLVAANDRVWTLTGNNLRVGGDLVRRTTWSTIDPAVPDPHLRTGFDIPDLERWVTDHRGELLHALLVLIRNWAAQGRPTTPRGSDSYATWIETVDGILTTAGHPGTFDHQESARQSIGSDDDEWSEFLIAVHSVFGERSFTAKELLAMVHDGREGWSDHAQGYDAAHPIPMDVLPGELVEKAVRSHGGLGLLAKTLGRWLANRDGRWAGELTVRAAGEDRKNVKFWKIHTVSRGGHHG